MNKTGLVFYADLSKHDGDTFMSDDAYGHLCTVTGALWGNQGRTFVSPNRITFSSSQLDFTTSDFTLLTLIKPTNLAADSIILNKGLDSVEGYNLRFTSSGRIRFFTYQAGLSQFSQTNTGNILINNWYLVGLVRSGTSCRIYKNGVNITTISGTHTDPVTSSRTVKIGIYDDEASTAFTGIIRKIFVYNIAFTPSEISGIHYA